MSINAMKLALAALETCRIRSVSEWSVEDITPKNVTAAIAAIRTAIQQAEAQQPATGEPVGFVDFQGTVFWHDGPPTADSLLFAAKPVSHDKAKWCEYVAGMVFTWLEMQENLKEEDRCIKAIAGIIERRMWALPTTHPAPSVPDDVVRDAERYRFIRDADVSDDLIPDIALYAMESLDEYIDAAMLAPKDSK